MSRYDLFRRRIAPIAFFVAIALIARDSCEKDKRTHTIVELELADRPSVRAVDVEVFAVHSSGDSAATGARVAAFHRAALTGAAIGPVRLDLALAASDAELRIDVDRGGQHQLVTRRIHVIDGSTTQISIPLPTSAR
ncbi:MAG: hypothetical protein ACRDMZ_01755 [Solirubrobacteraceae bacterium]